MDGLLTFVFITPHVKATPRKCGSIACHLLTRPPQANGMPVTLPKVRLVLVPSLWPGREVCDRDGGKVMLTRDLISLHAAFRERHAIVGTDIFEGRKSYSVDTVLCSSFSAE